MTSADNLFYTLECSLIRAVTDGQHLHTVAHAVVWCNGMKVAIYFTIPRNWLVVACCLMEATLIRSGWHLAASYMQQKEVMDGFFTSHLLTFKISPYSSATVTK